MRSHDGFYMDDNAEVEAFWSKKGIKADDMESGILMVIGRLRGMETLSILNNVVLYQGTSPRASTASSTVPSSWPRASARRSLRP